MPSCGKCWPSWRGTTEPDLLYRAMSTNGDLGGPIEVKFQGALHIADSGWRASRKLSHTKGKADRKSAWRTATPFSATLMADHPGHARSVDKGALLE